MPEDIKRQPEPEASAVTHGGLHKLWLCESLSWTSRGCLSLASLCPPRLLGLERAQAQLHGRKALPSNAGGRCNAMEKHHLPSQTVQRLNPICAVHLLSDLGEVTLYL